MEVCTACGAGQEANGDRTACGKSVLDTELECDVKEPSDILVDCFMICT